MCERSRASFAQLAPSTDAVASLLLGISYLQSLEGVCAGNKALAFPLCVRLMESAMRFPRTLVITASMTLLATGIALGQGAGGGPGGQGGMGTSAGSDAPAVGGGSPAGAVGGGPPAGRVGGGPPTSGGATPSPPAASGPPQMPMPPAEVRGIAEQPPSSTTGLSRPAEDGISTKTVPARPCSTAAKETDGTTTCVGIPVRK